MNQKKNLLDNILNNSENSNNKSKNQSKKHTANEKLNKNSKSNSSKNETNAKKIDKNMKHNNHKRKSISKSKSNNDKSNSSKFHLPWSCTLGLNNIAKLDSLEMIYHLKNRDDALSLVLNKSLDSLVKAKGSKGMQEYNLNKKLFLIKHKEQAKHHYWKFYTSRKYRKN